MGVNLLKKRVDSKVESETIGELQFQLILCLLLARNCSLDLEIKMPTGNCWIFLCKHNNRKSMV